MKPLIFRRRVLFFALPLLLLTAGCTASPQKETVIRPQLSGAYSVSASLQYGESQTAELTLTRCGKGNWDAEFSEPPALAGVLLTLEGNAVTASYKGLAFTVPKSAMPAKAMLCILTDVLDGMDTPDGVSCSRLEDGRLVCAGEAENGTYTVTFTDAGVLSEFEMPSQPLTAEFRDYRAGAAGTSAPPAQTTANRTVSADSTSGSTSGTASDTQSTAKSEGVSQ